MINNYNLEIYLSTHFGKNIKEITKEEFESLEMLSLDGINIDGLYEKIDFEDVMGLFPNVKRLVISNYVFSNNDIAQITCKNVNVFSFYKCDFTNVDNLDLFSNSLEFIIEKCIFNNYEFLYDGFNDLEVLCVTNPADDEEIDVSKLSCSNVTDLLLERCILSNDESFINLSNLEFVNLLNTEVSKEALIKIADISSLKNLFVSEKYTDEEVVKTFADKKINLKFNMNEFLFDDIEEDI